MVSSAEDDEATLGSMSTADCKVGAPRVLGEDTVTDGGAVEGCACLHHCLVFPAASFVLKDAAVHGGQ